MSDEDQFVEIELTVNGTSYSRRVEPRQLLVSFIRAELGLTGTHVGCDTSFCGACTVILNGSPIKSCTFLAVQADGADIITVEGLEKDGELHPIQQAFSLNHGLQCGFCTPGMLLMSLSLLADNPNPALEDIRKQLAGNVCRCTGYQNIIKSIHAATEALQRS